MSGPSKSLPAIKKRDASRFGGGRGSAVEVLEEVGGGGMVWSAVEAKEMGRARGSVLFDELSG
jgi:hypothetical protein